MDRDRITHVAADGPLLRTGADALELIFADDADLLVVPAQRLDPAFFDLSSGVAGEFAQKFNSMPVNKGAQAKANPEVVNFFASLKQQDIDWDFVQKNMGAWVEKIELEYMT